MQYLKEHEEEIGPATITVLLKKEDDFLSSASRPGSDLVWYSDEAKDRGGQGKGPSPLSYFLSSMGFCQLVHYAEHCMVDHITLDSLEIRVSGTISMKRPRRFTEVRYEAVIHSSAIDDVVKRLARAAADDCYVTNTLKAACRVTGTITHNGKKVDEHH
jgi:uncharacterized OsmC-like protein